MERQSFENTTEPANVEQKKYVETREVKLDTAQASVTEMFNRNMEAKGVIRRVVEDNKSSFSGFDDRRF
jgi:hypothetical protein